MATTPDKPKVYVESSTISYLTARPTEEPIRKAKQILTKQWWEQRDCYELFVSRVIVEEIERGDKSAADLRVDSIQGIQFLQPNTDSERLTRGLLESGAFPRNVEMDASHVALAAVHGMNFVVTWNQRHIASNAKRLQIEAIIQGFGFQPPRLVTPEQLLLEMEKTDDTH